MSPFKFAIAPRTNEIFSGVTPEIPSKLNLSIDISLIDSLPVASKNRSLTISDNTIIS